MQQGGEGPAVERILAEGIAEDDGLDGGESEDCDGEPSCLAAIDAPGESGGEDGVAEIDPGCAVISFVGEAKEGDKGEAEGGEGDGGDGVVEGFAAVFAEEPIAGQAEE